MPDDLLMNPNAKLYRIIFGFRLMIALFTSFPILGFMAWWWSIKHHLGGCRQVPADFKSMENALDMYKLNAGHYPTTAQGLRSLVEKPAIEPKATKWQQIMKTEPLDPWKTPYGYKFPGGKDPTKPEVISAGQDCTFGNEDDMSSMDD